METTILKKKSFMIKNQMIQTIRYLKITARKKNITKTKALA